MLTCYFLGEDSAPYNRLLHRSGWRIEDFKHSKTALEVVPKLKHADCRFCDLGAMLSAEMLFQLDLTLALKKEFCFVVSKTNIQRIPCFIDIKKHNVIVTDTPVTGESVPEKIRKQVQQRLAWIEIVVSRKLLCHFLEIDAIAF
jgi:hypothetical protein